MDHGELSYFAGSLGLCIAFAAGIIGVIHKRFQVMMADLCEGEARARFWTLAVEAWFILSAITSSLTWRPEGLDERHLFLSSICLIREGLHGMSNSIILFSAGLILFVVIRKVRGPEQMFGRKEAA